jgi:Cu/Ag efflux protein CusF
LALDVPAGFDARRNIRTSLKLESKFSLEGIMKYFRLTIFVWVIAILVAGLCFAQSTAGKKSYTFHGKVVSVDKSNKTLRIDGEKVEGWMEAMTMNYKTDNPSLIDKVKPGDQISATVYDGDYVLHNVKIAPPKN